LLEEVCLHWVVQQSVTREQVVRLLEHSLHAFLAATVPTPEAAHLGRDGQQSGT
jgi:hypothetical protein